MFKRSSIHRATLALLAGAVPLGSALAQTPPATEKTEKLETVVVTGSRIVRPNLVSATPVVSITAESLANVGMENFADIATQLPQFAPSFGASRTQSTFSGVAASGLNSANLRNLGNNRSLVLINGRRVPGGTSDSMVVDFNSIPTANIERIETITGGASAIYGADAVGGVINIITKKRLEGVEIGLSYGLADRGDNKNPAVSLLVGGRLGQEGRAMLTLEFVKDGQVSCADRDICSDDFAWLSPENQVFGPAARSGVGANGRFIIGSNSYTRRGSSFLGADGKLIPFSVSVDGYNRNAQRDLAIPTQRIVAAAEAEQRIAKGVTAYGEFNFAKNSVDSSFEGHPFQSNANTFGGQQTSIPVSNPFVPAELRAAAQAANVSNITWWQRFGNETLGGNRGANSDRTFHRAVVGLKGEFSAWFGADNDWQWDLFHVAGGTRVNLGTEGSVDLERLYHGLRVEADPANPGQFRCADVAARGNGCIPINPFAPYTPAMSSALSTRTTSVGASSLNNTIASASGSVFELPAGAVRASVGAEQRSFSGYLDHDTLINQGRVTGNQLGDTDKVKTTTKEVFAEVLVPLLADKPFARSLNFEGAFRNSKAGSQTYDTWKYGGDWEPVDGLRLRGMQARAVRTPVPSELSGIGQTFGVVNDPCTASRRNANPTRAANCATDGVPADYAPVLSIEQSVAGFAGGNPNLKPEEATTRTYGFVYTPSTLKGFSLAVDRFEIQMEDIISSVARQTAVNLCYDTTSRLLCGTRTRGTHPLLPGANYVLQSVNATLQNVAEFDLKGVDLDLRYSFKTGFGDMDLSTLATFYDKALLLPLEGQPTVDLLGQAGGSTALQGNIKFSATGNIGWRKGAFRANWNMRHIGRADMAVGTTEAGFPKIGSHTYHNLRGVYTASKSVELYAGVTNAFDKKPPVFASGTSGTQALDTIPGFYDVFGRSYFVGANLKF